MMGIKPIIDVLHRGQRISVQFSARQKGIAMRYDIFVNEAPVEVELFAEEVMRWLAATMHEEATKPPTTMPCSVEDALHCRDTQNPDCQFPHCQVRNGPNTAARKRRPQRR